MKHINYEIRPIRVIRSELVVIVLLCLCIGCAGSPRANMPLPARSGSREFDTAAKRKQIVAHAINTIGAPYRWGGTSMAKGFDCSGLVVYAYQQVDLHVPRMTGKQFEKGTLVLPRNLQPADLVFFNTSSTGKLLHVGLYIGDGRFVHSPGTGRQVTFAYLENPYFSSRFIGARSFID